MVVAGGHSGDLASTLCKYDLKKEDLLVLSWARVRQRCAQYFVNASCG